ncbi:MAG: hypothetical protein DYG85_06405 [Chloroflexi bacterium CFX1]|nr:conserved hypothetical protein [Virus Rctr41k]MCE7919136.1 hypothetical protein [Chloroflexi bacterium CFX1]
MTVLLSDLITKLETDVPAVDGVPTDDQYENAVKDAVRAFGERCGVEQVGTLNITSGTATYSLPDDFLRLIAMSALTGVDGVIVSSGGLIPVPLDYEEKWTIRNGQITFYPTPQYTIARTFRYKAGWVLTESDDDYPVEEYAEMTERESRIVLLAAASFATQKLANNAGGDKYSLGAVSVDNSGSVEALVKKQYSLFGEFTKECDLYNGGYSTA